MEYTLLMAGTEKAQNAGPIESEEIETTEQVAPEIPVDPGLRQEEQEERVQEEVQPLDQDLRNAEET